MARLGHVVAHARAQDDAATVPEIGGELGPRGRTRRVPARITMPLMGTLHFEAAGLEFLRDWALPHFYFHVVTAYDILRHHGVDLGKQDYLRHEKARSALARRDTESALAAVDEHARAFPRGQLSEMREALAVQALVYAGRATDARARADQFHRRFPSSMYRPVVDGAISSIP